MLKESLKWMLLTLLVAVLLVAAAAGLSQGMPPVSLSAKPVATPVPEADTPTPAPSPTDTPAPTPMPTPTPLPPTADDWIRAYMAGMSTEEKLGQLVLFGFSGTDEPGTAFSDLMETYRIGNLILYGANIKSGDRDGGFSRCAGLIDTVKERMGGEIPPLVAIDVEGGSVVRFTWENWPASARTLGRRNDPDYAAAQFETIGKKLRETGIQLNLAPVLDVSEDPMSTFLQTRIISADADVAAEIGVAVVEGLHRGGCLSAAKHFPGHGGTTKDSHDVTPVIDKTAEELASYDLTPFLAAIDGGVDAILVTHILFPSLDEQDIASLSEPVITGLLRGQMGFDGIVISDDFRMGGLTSRYEPGEAAVKFLLAGGDLIMCGAQPDRQAAILKGLTEAAADGRLPAERIDESVFRILQRKLAVTGWQAEIA